jgi:imidazoleglycerol phosphate dehydratase HisB
MPIKQERNTKETSIAIELEIVGTQQLNIDTGLPFFDHMLTQLAHHAGWDLTLKATGDLAVDDHHLIEDTAICLGEVLQTIWRTRKGMQRYGQRFLPMDEVLVLCAIDLSGRPYCSCDLPFSREIVGKINTEMWSHFFHSLAMAGRFTLQIKTFSNGNNHHLVEASFKALAYALSEALEIKDRSSSTKGVL